MTRRLRAAREFTQPRADAHGGARRAGTPSPCALTRRLAALAGVGRPLEDGVRREAEARTQRDLSSVRVFEDSAAALRLGAAALAVGDQLHFAPGAYSRENLWHELGHVEQQLSGRVRANRVVGGVPLNDSPALEAEADRLAQRPRSQGRSGPAPATSRGAMEGPAPAAPVVQRQLWRLFNLRARPTVHRMAEVVVDVMRDSPVRALYKQNVARLGERAQIYAAQSQSAMDIGADPMAEVAPPVMARQALKDTARASTPAFMMDFIKDRQVEKYGPGKDTEAVADPTAQSLMAKKLDKGVSAEQAVVDIVLSAGRADPDIFPLVKQWLARKDPAYVEDAAMQMIKADSEVLEKFRERLKKL